MNIDFVIPWVDNSDTAWLNDFSFHATKSEGDKREARFRDWDNLKYWFRGVEKFAPWVNKVHLVTCGHYPNWLNINEPKLNIVKHSDYIPHEYLPTFNTHTIELNIHRIPNLADNFVFFNDDIFILKKLSPSCYFRNNLPCDMPVLNLLAGSNKAFSHILMCSSGVVQNRFNKHKVIFKSFWKWLNPIYGLHLFKTLALLPWPKFSGFMVQHLAQPYKKEVFHQVWEADKALLDLTCKSKFRRPVNINHYAMRYWQFATGQFWPKNITLDSSYFYVTNDNIPQIANLINKQLKAIVVINDNESQDFEFDRAKATINEAFSRILPDKSCFEQ